MPCAPVVTESEDGGGDDRGLVSSGCIAVAANADGVVLACQPSASGAAAVAAPQAPGSVRKKRYPKRERDGADVGCNSDASVVVAALSCSFSPAKPFVPSDGLGRTDLPQTSVATQTPPRVNLKTNVRSVASQQNGTHEPAAGPARGAATGSYYDGDARPPGNADSALDSVSAPALPPVVSHDDGTVLGSSGVPPTATASLSSAGQAGQKQLVTPATGSNRPSRPPRLKQSSVRMFVPITTPEGTHYKCLSCPYGTWCAGRVCAGLGGASASRAAVSGVWIDSTLET